MLKLPGNAPKFFPRKQVYEAIETIPTHPVQPMSDSQTSSASPPPSASAKSANQAAIGSSSTPPSPKTRLNLQPVGGQVKPYQVTQFLKLVQEYNFTLEDEPDPS